MRGLIGLCVAAALVVLGGGAEAGAYRLLKLDGNHLKWGAPTLGEPARITWGFATVAESFPDAINCGALAPMDAISGVWGGDPARIEAIAAEAFALWSGAAAIEFVRAAPGARPDLLIGTQGAPRKVAFANVWPDATRAEAGVAPLARATICFNPEAPWTIADEAASDPALDLRTVLAHEIGHAIGLDHPGATGPLMGFQPQGTMRALTPGDVAGAAAIYGPRR